MISESAVNLMPLQVLGLGGQEVRGVVSVFVNAGDRATGRVHDVHSKAFSVLQATDLPPGTVEAAEAEGKCCSNISRYQYPSLVVGGLMGKRSRSACLLTRILDAHAV